MGETPDKQALGGARTQTQAGAVDNEAADEDDALAQLRRFLSYLPDNVWELPPVTAATDPADRREEELLSIVPRDARRPYKMRRILDAVLDRGSAFEVGPRYGRSLITMLARLDGRPVGVLASDPHHYAGGLTADASDKLTRFVDLCDTFRLPVVNLVDQPGFLIGTASERAGTIRRGTRALVAVLPGHGPVGVGARAQGLRRGGRGPRRPFAPEPPLRVAVRRLGLAADRRRAARPRTGASSRPPATRPRCAPRSRRA